MKSLRGVVIALTLVALALALAGPRATPAQPSTNPAGIQAARDKAAAEEALSGWWAEAQKTRDQRLAWWREARFGCFIHWGVYADPAGEYNGKKGGSYSEHIMRQIKIPLAEYKEKVVKPFNPSKFNADEWADLFQQAGMRYVVITAKHHDGFAMFPSDAYPYDIRMTQFKRDPMKELSEACRKRGIRFGFYYSHAFDWEHPDAPGNDWDYDQPGGDKLLHGGAQWYNSQPALVERAKNYVDKKAIPQLLELIQKYHPDIFWFDTAGKLPFSEQIRIVKAVRKADPNVVINGRSARGMGKSWGDYVNTGDNPAEVKPTEGDWENIPTVNHSYGYNKLDNDYKTPEFLIRLLVKTNAKGGNYLMNIGPKGDGTIDENATRILKGIGAWMKTNKESIYGTVTTPLDRQSWGDSTYDPTTHTLYLHVFDWPSDGKLVVGGLQSTPKVALPLALKSEMINAFDVQRLNADDLVVRVGQKQLDPIDSVIALPLDGAPKATPGRVLLSDVPTNRFLAFDATLSNGKDERGFTSGDGKAERYWVTGFRSPRHTATWKYRVNEQSTFEVRVTYSTTADEPGGAFQVKVGDQTLKASADPSPKMATLNLGRVTLAPGSGEIVFQTQKEGGGLVQLFEVNLVPVK